MKRFEFYVAIAAVVFFFGWALSAQYKVDRLEKKNSKLKSEVSVMAAENVSLKASITLQNIAINSLSDVSRATLDLLETEMINAKKVKAEADIEIDSIRRQSPTGDCEKIRVRMIDHAIN